jgi:hypothetical protein
MYVYVYIYIYIYIYTFRASSVHSNGDTRLFLCMHYIRGSETPVVCIIVDCASRQVAKAIERKKDRRMEGKGRREIKNLMKCRRRESER